MLAERAILGRDEFDRLRGKPPTERAANWLQCDYYTFLVHTRLRPHDPVAEQAMFETIKWMRSKLQHLAVLDGLTRARQEQLAALVIDFLAFGQNYESYRRGLRWVREDRQLLGKRELAKLRKATEILETVAKRLSDGELKRLKRLVEGGLVKPSPDHDPHPKASRLKRIAAAVRMLTQEFEHKMDFKTYREYVQDHLPNTTDSKVDASKQLHWFFVSKCRLAKNEAQVRVAKIGEGIFGEEVRYREKYEGEDLWKGSTTIRQRVEQGSQSKLGSKPKSKAKSARKRSTKIPIDTGGGKSLPRSTLG